MVGNPRLGNRTYRCENAVFHPYPWLVESAGAKRLDTKPADMQGRLYLLKKQNTTKKPPPQGHINGPVQFKPDAPGPANIQVPHCHPVALGDGPSQLGKRATRFPSSTFRRGAPPARPRDDLLFALRLWYVPGVIFTNWSALWTQRPRDCVCATRLPRGARFHGNGLAVSSLAGRF